MNAVQGATSAFPNARVSEPHAGGPRHAPASSLATQPSPRESMREHGANHKHAEEGHVLARPASARADRDVRHRETALRCPRHRREPQANRPSARPPRRTEGPGRACWCVCAALRGRACRRAVGRSGRGLAFEQAGGWCARVCTLPLLLPALPFSLLRPPSSTPLVLLRLLLCCEHRRSLSSFTTVLVFSTPATIVQAPTLLPRHRHTVS